MLDALKRLISREPPAPEWPELAQWAKAQRMLFKRVRDEGGFVIDGGMETKPWRLEWGAPQRQYIGGAELRLRIDLGVSSDLQMLLLSETLFEALERSTFESFTETTQTVVDGNTPEEMRWLVMFPQSNFQASKAVRSRFRAIGSSPTHTTHWVEGELAKQLEVASVRFLKEQPPFMLMVLRGRVYLRMRMSEPDVPSVSQAIGVFEAAVLQTIRTATLVAEEGEATRGWHGNGEEPTAWQTQLGPEDPLPRGGPH
jgi:hypothetical protein